MSKFSLKVISRNDESWPFMRGMMTHSLVQHGMEFKKAYKVAQQVKNKLIKKESIPIEELRTVVENEIEKNFGHKDLQKYKRPAEVSLSMIKVRSRGSETPFSKGLLARSISAAGIPPNHAHQMAQELQYKLYRDGIKEITTQNLYKRVHRQILNESGEETAEFYRLAISINRMDRPVIIYIGGGIGTGKSSLATELAARLNISKVTGTDMVRQIVRMMFTEKMLPELHRSTFSVGDDDSSDGVLEKSDVLAGFLQQSIKVNVGVQAVVERAINENINMIFEGVHLLPSLLQFENLSKKAYHIPVLISLSNPESHRSRFGLRQKAAASRKAERYQAHFDEIRQIHDHSVEIAGQHKVDVINNEDFDRSINQLLLMVLTNLQKQVASRPTRTAKK
ncbi:MAG: hypothetical protein HQM13_01245 [SAR324 cluster bacterium]|nr:hypothetical protein [SAR324 cluster bacterium]